MSLHSLIGRPLACALRKNPHFIVKWCLQLGNAYRDLSRLRTYDLNVPTIEDVFVREDGSLILGNISVIYHSSSLYMRDSMREGDQSKQSCFLRFLCSVLSSALDTSRRVEVDLPGCHRHPEVSADPPETIDLNIAEGNELLLTLNTGSQTGRVLLSTSTGGVESLADGDFILSFDGPGDTVATLSLCNSLSFRASHSRSSSVMGDGGIHVKVHGVTAGSCRWVLKKICADDLLTLAAFRVHVTSYDVCLNPDVEELISLLSFSYEDVNPLAIRAGYYCRVLGSNLLIRQVRC